MEALNKGRSYNPPWIGWPYELKTGAGEGIRTPEPLRDRSLWTHSRGVFSPAPLTWLGYRENESYPRFQAKQLHPYGCANLVVRNENS